MKRFIVLCVAVVFGTALWAANKRELRYEHGAVADKELLFFNSATALAQAAAIYTDETELYFSNSRTKWLSLGVDVQAEVEAMVHQSCVFLPTGTYTITDDIDVTNSCAVIGAGPGRTIIVCNTDSKNVFHVNNSNCAPFYLANLTILVTASSTCALQIDRQVTTVSDAFVLENVDIVLASHAGNQYAIYTKDVGVTLKNCNISCASTDGWAIGLYQINTANAEAAITSHIWDSSITTSTAAAQTAVAIDLQDGNGATSNAYVYNSNLAATTAGGTAAALRAYQNADAAIYAYGTTCSGSTADVIQ
ncbi:MAG: glycosyl hydrolase family 28-related protein, partial [Verrucomicrobiota bacterium]